MVSGRRPLWICKIKRRVSMNKFKRTAKKLAERDEDILRVLKGVEGRHAYKVKVETMEDCEHDCYEDVWVPEELARATGWMFDEFDADEEIRVPEDVDDDDDDDEPVSEDVEEEYQKMCKEETSKASAEDSGESEDELTDFDEPPHESQKA